MIFLHEVNVEALFFMVVARHAQSTHNNKVPVSLQHLGKKGWNWLFACRSFSNVCSLLHTEPEFQQICLIVSYVVVFFAFFFSVFSVKKENWNRKEKIGNLSFFEIPSKIKVLFIINFNVTSYLLLSFAVFFCYYTFKLNRFYGFMVVSCICCSTLVFLVK